MVKSYVLKEKKLIAKQIKQYVPYFASLLDNDLTLKEFSNQLYNFKVFPEHTARQELIKLILKRKSIQLFGPEANNKLQINLTGPLAFNIADHHQVLNHPFLISANLVSSVNKFFRPTKQDAIFVISSGDVPPNNYFSKNGFVLHGKRAPLFSVSEREYCTYYIPKRDFNFIDRLKTNHFSEQNFLLEHQKIINSLDYSGCQDYKDQISIIIKNTWPLLYNPAIRNNLPDLIYITQEELITEFLLDLIPQNNFITAFLFNPKLRQKTLDNFRGNVVAWREKEGKGTHFFWLKHPEAPRSIRMYIKDDWLIPQHQTFQHLKIHLEPNTIISKLKSREIFPSLFTIFSVLNFYAGVRPLTGYGSTVYLSFFKESWLKTLKNTKYEDELDSISSIDALGLVAGLVLFYKRQNEKLKVQYAHDIFCDGYITTDYLHNVFEMKFKDALAVGLADMYDYFSQKYIPINKKIKKTITFDDLANLYFNWI